MKIPVVVASLLALSAADAISGEKDRLMKGDPGDNSGYVEGVSRYIWMPDGKGVPHLVDLNEPVNELILNSTNEANSQYWLYTRKNPYVHQSLVHGDIDSVLTSSYSANRSTNVIVHGWKSNGYSDVNGYIRDAFLDSMDCNVIVVDWSSLANNSYVVASAGVPQIGEFLGGFLVWLFNNAGGDWNKLHLVGHSLGAHVVGNAGRATGGLPRRVTGCDPAAPLWIKNPYALNTKAGVYVEVIHTDGGVLGIYHRVGHVDFYPNGGTNPQPGCLLSLCSHRRSYKLFAATVHYKHLSGQHCDDLNQVSSNSCSGPTLEMGNDIISKSGDGIFRLNTKRDWPY